MKSTLYDTSLWQQLPREQVMERMRRIIREELTELQRYTLVAYYFENRNLQQIADARCVNKSTVARTLKRAEEKLRRYLK